MQARAHARQGPWLDGFQGPSLFVALHTKVDVEGAEVTLFAAQDAPEWLQRVRCLVRLARVPLAHAWLLSFLRLARDTRRGEAGCRRNQGGLRMERVAPPCGLEPECSLAYGLRF
jgi:hypothetical protein